MGGPLRFKVAELMNERGWTAYKLAEESGLTLSTAYRVADPDAEVQRIEADTLKALCDTFGCHPGALLDYTPDPTRPLAKRGKATG